MWIAEHVSNLKAALAVDDQRNTKLFLLAESDDSSHTRTVQTLEDASGTDVGTWTFVLGDAVGMTSDEKDCVLQEGGAILSVGKASLLADQCITLVQYHMDEVLGGSPVR